MTKTKSTKRALLTSALALLMCVSMLIGSTFAWFTDSVTSSGNIIKSGTLDVTMEWKDATASGAQQTYKDASEGAIFNYNLWEPGYVEAKNIKIGNAGTLALKYQLNIVATGEVSELADVIDVYYAEGEHTLADRTMSELTKIGTLTDVLAKISTTASGDLLAGESDTVTLALKMQESAGNQYQNLAIGSEFAVQLLATQLTAETDSFDNQYDADADFVVYYNTPGTYELNATLMATKATDVITVRGADVVLNITGGYYDVGSQDCAVWARNGGVVNIYGGTFIGDGVGTATSALHQDLIYASGGSKINIYGGTFSSRTDDWLLNEQDNKGEIVVYGGTFVNWNPADNVSEGPSTSFLAEGYDVIVETKGEDTYYTVVKGTVVSTAAELQSALDSAKDGDTIMLVSGVNYGTVYMGRPTKNNDTTMTCNDGTNHSNAPYTTTSAEEFAEHLADGKWHTTPRYTTTLKNLTVIGAEGATIAGIVTTSGHAYGDVYDYVLDKDRDVGSAYYNTLNMENIVFSNVNFTGTVNINTSDAASVYDGVTFDGCTFTTGGTASTNGPAIRYYNEANNGNVRNIVVNDCTFTNCYQGVYVQQVNGVTVTGCTFNTTGHNAIAIQSTNAPVALKNVVITGNTFENIGDRVIRFGEIAADSNITIQNNTATNSGDEDGEVMRAVSIENGITTSISNNTWNGVVVNDELKDN